MKILDTIRDERLTLSFEVFPPKTDAAFTEVLQATEEIARLIRLRNLSGIIIVDFISMKDKEKEKNLLQKLREFVRNDPAGVTVVDVTSLGLVEITRKKRGAPLKEVFMTSGQNIPADR